MPAAKYCGWYKSESRYKRLFPYHFRILDDLRKGLDPWNRVKPGTCQAIAKKHRLSHGTVTRAVWDLRKEGHLPTILPKYQQRQPSEDSDPTPPVTPGEIEAGKQAIRRERGHWFEQHGPHKPDPRQFIRELQEWGEAYVKREAESTKRYLFTGMIVTYGNASREAGQVEPRPTSGQAAEASIPEGAAAESSEAG
jgi:hypothetical protein